MSETQPIPREVLREAAERWRDRLEQGVRQWIDRPDAPLEELYETILREGILEHLAPTSSEERVARQSLGRTLVSGQDDPGLWWSTLYTTESFAHSTEKRHTLASGYAAAPLSTATYLLASVWKERLPQFTRVDEKYPEYRHVDPVPFIRGFGRFVFERMREKGMSVEGHPIPIGSTGRYKGISVTVERYGLDGSLCFQTSNRNDHAALWDLMGERPSADPSTADPKEFTPLAS